MLIAIFKLGHIIDVDFVSDVDLLARELVIRLGQDHGLREGKLKLLLQVSVQF